MEKVKLELVIPKNKKIEYGDSVIEVTPFLTVSQEVFLINKYLESLFKESKDENSSGYNYLDAEYSLTNYLYQLVTNIDIEYLDTEMYADSSLFELVTSAIPNYWDFRSKLDYIVKEKKESIILENSIGKVLSQLINKAYDILDKISEISPEEIKKLQETGIEIANKLEKSSILTGIPDNTPKKSRRKSSNVGEV